MLPPYFFRPLVELAVLLPILWLCRRRDMPRATLLIALFAGYHLLDIWVHYLPFTIDALWVGGDYNWGGKVGALVFGLVFYLATRKLYAEHQYVNLRPAPGWIHKLGLLTLAVYVVALLLAAVDYLVLRQLFDWSVIGGEEFAFDVLGVAAWSEEIAYRGVMLGLLVMALRPLPLPGTNWQMLPAIWITGLLFGTAHGFFIEDDWTFTFDWGEIARSTVLSGAFFAWMTVRSGSIFTPVLLHWTIFFIVTLL